MHLNAKTFHRDKDGEEGFPGKLDVICIFTLVGTSLNILYEARTNKDWINDKFTHIRVTPLREKSYESESL